MAQGSGDRRQRKRILIVNDTQEILELFQDLLGAMGHDVALMSYAPHELDRVREVDPDLVIIDFIVGGREFTGWQLLQKLRMDRELQSVPVIICTAAVREVREQEGYLTEQNVLVLLKPFTLDQLEGVVGRALGDVRGQGDGRSKKSN
jgi:CheY-like chemotaxis protein